MSLHYPLTEPPAPGEVLSVAPGILWLRMPLPFQLNHINLWLLEDGPGWTVVDTGVGLDETRALWGRLFASHFDGRPLVRVVVTHFHPDHMGNAAWLTERWETVLWCTEPEWRATHAARQGGREAEIEARLEHFRRHGGDEEALAQVRYRSSYYTRLVPTVAPEFRALHGGDVLSVG